MARASSKSVTITILRESSNEVTLSRLRKLKEVANGLRNTVSTLISKKAAPTGTKGVSNGVTSRKANVEVFLKMANGLRAIISTVGLL